jgi:integral membrane protein
VTEPSSTSTASFPSVARPLRIAAVAEAVSYLALMVAVIAKNVFDAAGEGGVPVVGPIHGIIFLIYAVLVLMGREEQRWGLGSTLLALVLSAVPFGGFYVDQKMITPEPSPP